MKKQSIRKTALTFSAAALALILAGCGGGGGGGGSTAASVSPPAGTTSRTIQIDGTFTPAAGREAGREADAVASKKVVAYVLGDETHRQLNSPSDSTDATGKFTITANLGSVSSANIVVELLDSSSTAGDPANLKAAVEAAAANVTGLAGNDTTSAETTLWGYNSSESLATTIKPVVALLSSTVVAKVRSQITSSGKGQEFVTVLKSVYSDCKDKTGAEKKTCIIDKTDAKLATVSDATVASVVNDVQVDYVQSKVNTDVTSSTTADKIKLLAPSSTYAAINTLVAISDEAAKYSQDVSIANIDQSDEAQELLSKLAPAIAAYKANTGAARSAAVKNELLATLNGATFSVSYVKSYFMYLKAGYASKIATEAVANTTKMTSGDMTSLISGYDTILGALVEVFVNNGKVSSDTASSMVKGLIYTLTKFGDASENNSSMQAVLDDWVTAYAVADFRDKLHAFLDPLGMTDRTKTQYLMELIRDLGYTDGSRAAVLAKLNEYKTASKLNQATVDNIMVLYDKYYGKLSCSVNYTTKTIGGSNCITQVEILTLFELHFEKSLPVFNAVMTGLQDWVKDPSNTNKLIGVGTAYTVIQNIYPQMKASSTAKAEYGVLLDNAGINKELFWLVMNLEPYYNAN